MSKTLLIQLRDYLIGSLSMEDKEWLITELQASNINDSTSFACPYTSDEVKNRLMNSIKDVEAGNVYTTDEVLAMCREDIGIYDRVAV